MGEATSSLSAAMRRLWADHVIWTRQYIVAAVGDTPDAQAAAGRLLKNQEASATPSSPSTARRPAPVSRTSSSNTSRSRWS